MHAHNKPIFDGLLHTGKPDLEALYRVGKIPMVTQDECVWLASELG